MDYNGTLNVDYSGTLNVESSELTVEPPYSTLNIEPTTMVPPIAEPQHCLQWNPLVEPPPSPPPPQ